MTHLSRITTMVNLLNRLTEVCSTPSMALVVGAYKWNTVLRGFVESNAPKKVILAYALMSRKGVKVDSFTLLFVIKACGLIMHGILLGKQIHAQITKLGFQPQQVTMTALLQMYGLFGDLEAANKLFSEISHRDLVQWNALLAVYSKRNRPRSAIETARQMISENVMPNEVTVVSVVSACSQLKALPEGKQWHGYVIKNLAVFDTFVHNALINMYAICGCLSDAQNVFKNLKNRNQVSWTSIINAYGNSGCPVEALSLMIEMQAIGDELDEVAILAVVSICSKLGRSDLGEWIEDYIQRYGFYENTHISNALIDMHNKCGNIEKSCRIFDQMTTRTLITWTAMIQGLAMHGQGQAAITRFSQMQIKGFRLDEIYFLSMINACSHAGLVEEGKHFWRCMIEDHRMNPWIEHYGSMVDLLCRAGLMSEAFRFAIDMPMKPDSVIWRTLIGACRDQGNVSLARQVLDYIIELEPEHSANYILKSNLYAMIGDWESVQEVRSSMRCGEINKRQPAHSYIGLQVQPYKNSTFRL